MKAFSSSAPTPITKRKWRICLIGSGLRFYAEDDVRAPLDVKINNGSEARLLALLLLSHRSEGVTTWTTASIADALWASSDVPDANSKTNTRKAIERLMKALQPWTDGSFAPLVTRKESHLFLHREAYSTDLEAADIRYRVARQNFAPNTSESRNAWKDFLAFCGTDDILSRWDAVTNIFLVSPRQQLNRKRMEASVRLAENAEVDGDLEIALRYARQAISLPAAESNLLTQANQVINRILGGKPAPTISDIGPPRYAPIAPGRSEHPVVDSPVFSFSPSVPFYGNLFFGREREIETLNHYAENPDTRLVTLCGTAGVGKTRLLLEWAARWQSFQQTQHDSPEPRSLFLVNLTALRWPEQVPDATREALKLSPVPGRDLIEQVTAFLRGLYRPILLFDNAEHLQTPASQNGTSRDEDPPLAVFFELLLKHAPEVTLMVTSRQILDLPAEQPLFVTSLLPDESIPTAGPFDTVADIQKWDGACLFVDRANKARAHKAQNIFALREDNAATIGRIVRLLDGLPLALELAAGNMASYRLGQIETMLENTLNGTAPPESFWRLTSRRFAGVSSSEAARHASLWAAVTLSFETLSPVCQHLLTRLSVFRGGATLDALQAVCFDAFGEDAPHAHELSVLLEGLERQSLLQVRLHRDASEDNGQSMSTGEGEIRYFLLETLRAFGKAVLTETERLRLSRHHAAYFLRLVQAADKDAYTTEAARAFALIDAERANIETALGFLINVGANDSTARIDALRLVGALRLFRVEEKWLEPLLALPPGCEDDLSPEEKAVRVSALCRMGWICVEKGAAAQAEVWARQGIDLAKETGASVATQAELWRLLGASKMENEPAQAHAIYLTVVAMAEESSDDVVLCNTLHGLGTLAIKQNDLEAGKKWYEQSLGVSQRIGYLRRAAITIGALGSVLMLWRRYPEALFLAQESLAIQTRLKNSEGIAHAQRLIGEIYLLSGDPDNARPFFENYERNAKRAGNHFDLGLIRRSFGSLALQEGRWLDAFRELLESLYLLHPLGLPRETAASLCWCAIVAGVVELPEACTVLWHAGTACCAPVGELGDLYLMEKSEPYLAQARAVLGEGAYARAQEEGCHLTAEGAIRYVEALVFQHDATGS